MDSLKQSGAHLEQAEHNANEHEREEEQDAKDKSAEWWRREGDLCDSWLHVEQAEQDANESEQKEEQEAGDKSTKWSRGEGVSCDTLEILEQAEQDANESEQKEEQDAEDRSTKWSRGEGVSCDTLEMLEQAEQDATDKALSRWYSGFEVLLKAIRPRPNLSEKWNIWLRRSSWKRREGGFVDSELELLEASVPTSSRKRDDGFEVQKNEGRSHHRSSLPNKLPGIEPKELESGRLIGQGLSGIVYETKYEGKRRARKDFPGVDKNQFEAIVDTLLAQELRHLNIGVCIGKSVGYSCCSLVLEYEPDNLHNVVRMRKFAGELPFEILEAMSLMSQIANAVKYLHEQGVAHGDLKPNNVLISRPATGQMGTVKVVDYGLSEIKEGIRLATKRTRYLDIFRSKAPERFQELIGSLRKDLDDPFLEYDTDSESDSTDWPGSDECCETKEAQQKIEFMKSADIYSFGMTCYWILTRDVPFSNTSSLNEAWKGIREGQDIDMRKMLTLPEECPAELQTLIQTCLNKEPNKRPSSFANICNELDKLKIELTATLVIHIRGAELDAGTTSGHSSSKSMEVIEPNRPTCKASDEDMKVSKRVRQNGGIPIAHSPGREEQEASQGIRDDVQDSRFGDGGSIEMDQLCFELKHKILLNHIGLQKSYVEHECKDEHSFGSEEQDALQGVCDDVQDSMEIDQLGFELKHKISLNHSGPQKSSIKHQCKDEHSFGREEQDALQGMCDDVQDSMCGDGGSIEIDQIPSIEHKCEDELGGELTNGDFNQDGLGSGVMRRGFYQDALGSWVIKSCNQNELGSGMIRGSNKGELDSEVMKRASNQDGLGGWLTRGGSDEEEESSGMTRRGSNEDEPDSGVVKRGIDKDRLGGGLTRGGLNEDGLGGGLIGGGSNEDELCSGLTKGGFNEDELCSGLTKGGFNEDELCSGLTKGGFNEDDLCSGLTKGGFNEDDFCSGLTKAGFNEDGLGGGLRRGGFNEDELGGLSRGGFNEDGLGGGMARGGFNEDGLGRGLTRGGLNEDGLGGGLTEGGLNEVGLGGGFAGGGLNEDGLGGGLTRGGFNEDGLGGGLTRGRCVEHQCNDEVCIGFAGGGYYRADCSLIMLENNCDQLRVGRGGFNYIKCPLEKNSDQM